MKTSKIKSSHNSNTKGNASRGDWHVSHSSMGMGDYYGTGIKQKLGKMRDSYGPTINPTSKKGLKIPPTSLA